MSWREAPYVSWGRGKDRQQTYSLFGALQIRQSFGNAYFSLGKERVGSQAAEDGLAIVASTAPAGSNIPARQQRGKHSETAVDVGRSSQRWTRMRSFHFF